MIIYFTSLKQVDQGSVPRMATSTMQLHELRVNDFLLLGQLLRITQLLDGTYVGKGLISYLECTVMICTHLFVFRPLQLELQLHLLHNPATRSMRKITWHAL